MNIIVKNANLSKWLVEKDILVKEGRDLTKQIDDLEAKRNTCGMKIQKLKDKIIPLAEKLVAPHLPEFGYLIQVNPDKNGVSLEYIDRVEEFKKAMIEEKKKKNGKDTTDSKE